jgi:hypothetical protein
MFPSDISGILPDQALKNTCGICGEPINPLESLAGDPLGKPRKCKTCKQQICGKHFSASRQQCVKCETGRDSWCKTPDIPGLPGL